jgi:hypothetical protein
MSATLATAATSGTVAGAAGAGFAPGRGCAKARVEALVDAASTSVLAIEGSLTKLGIESRLLGPLDAALRSLVVSRAAFYFE